MSETGREMNNSPLPGTRSHRLQARVTGSLEIWSTGTLPAGLTPEKLKRAHESVPRNRLIADVCYRRGLIERWGRGTNKILAEAKKAGCPEPEFEEIAGAFVVRFMPAAGTVGREPPFELRERGEKVLAILRESGPLRAPEILKRLGEPIALRTLQRELRGLRETGHIVATGRGELTSYRVAGGQS